MKKESEVLFVCVHNAGRSQMAAGLVKLRSEGRILVRSAGSSPGDELNPAVVEAMSELGVDLGEEFPKPLTDEVVRAADVVVTMGCGDACPIYPGKRYEDWQLDDPAGRDLDAVRRIRDQIDERVQRLITDLEEGPDMSAETSTDVKTCGCDTSCCTDGEPEDGCCDDTCCVVTRVDQTPAPTS